MYMQPNEALKIKKKKKYNDIAIIGINQKRRRHKRKEKKRIMISTKHLLIVKQQQYDPRISGCSITDESSCCAYDHSPVKEDVVPRSPKKLSKIVDTTMNKKLPLIPFGTTATTASTTTNHKYNSEVKDNVKVARGGAVTSSMMKESTTTKDIDDDNDDDNENVFTSAIESDYVDRIRSCILTCLIMIFLFVGVIFYFIISQDNEQNFDIEYTDAVHIITIAIQSQLLQKISILNDLSTISLTSSIVSQAATMSYTSNNSANNMYSSSWPSVTIPNFEHHAYKLKQLSNSLYLGFNPIVTTENRMQWENYVRTESSSWMTESIQFGLENDLQIFGSSYWNENHLYSGNMSDIWTPIYNANITSTSSSIDDVEYSIETNDGPYVPIWQTSPLLRSMVNQNTLRYSSTLYQDMERSIDSNSILLGNIMTSSSGNMNSPNFMSSYFASLLSTSIQKETSYEGDPMTHIYFPIRKNNNLNSSYSTTDDNVPPDVVAVAVSLIQWGSLFSNILPSHVKSIVAVMESSCEGNFTYYITGHDVQYAGSEGDYHDKKFDRYAMNITLDDIIMNYQQQQNETIQSICSITFHIYPTNAMYEQSITILPKTIGSVLFVLFLITICMFIIFDRVVEGHRSRIEAKAEITGSMLTSLFPKDVANRLINQSNITNNQHMDYSLLSNKHRLKSFLQPNCKNLNDGCNPCDEPIADLFPETTVLFSDIAGFTAWSSSREPSQVFVLLQSVYQSFDILARRRRVFKVETIGDSYVAVTGLPDPQEHHALIMARFATECQQKMTEITNELVVKLGPDTSELTMRMGMHSGPVTGGVLGGDKARFQLFGDTVNTAARMESTGMKEKIQVSLEAAKLIMAAGKTYWLTPRKDPVVAKGKGVLTTYWLNIQTTTTSRTSFSSTSDPLMDDSSRYYMDNSSKLPVQSVCTANLSNPDPAHAASKPSSIPVEGSFRDEVKHDRLIDWLSEVLQSHILRVIASRTVNANRMSGSSSFMKHNVQDPIIIPTGPPMNEVVEAISLPEYQANYKKYCDNELNMVELNPIVVAQLREYVSIIARHYNENPFHNFEHACHVTMSVNKLLMRVTAPDIDVHKMARKATQAYRQLHDYTHGINSDAITQLGIVFSAIIHDVDHKGISNVQLCKEQPELATKYNSQSVAEQNSLDIAWDLLMSDQFKLLRSCVFKTIDELQRFRQVVVNTVIATDIFDKELKELRQKRWETAFSSQINALGYGLRKNLQATIVIEHLMQASDVSHTMQHWHVYRKWNARLFKELYLAFRDGRMAGNPCEFWYKGELGFFDNYIIPLAKKLKECNVFGVSSDEYLNYAEKNRAEWAIRGEEIVSEMILEVTR